MITLQLYVENIAGDWFGWIEDFPGAYVSGITAQEVERSAPRACAEYLQWLRLHGEPLPDDLSGATSADFGAQTVQSIDMPAESPAEAAHFMASDGRAMEAPEFERALRLLRHSRAELKEVAGNVPPHEWDMAPLGGRSIRAFLQQLGECEAALLGRVASEQVFRSLPDPMTALDRLRSHSEAVVSDLFHKDKMEIVQRGGSAWSLQKVFRLALWQERSTALAISARSNPAKYLRSVSRLEAVVQNRDSIDHYSRRSERSEEQVTMPRHTQAPAYYY